jgi:hypothetical protein
VAFPLSSAPALQVAAEPEEEKCPHTQEMIRNAMDMWCEPTA